MTNMFNLYENLMELTATNEAFYFVDHVYNGRTYRIFTYRLASYSDFLLPGALECRGHTFLLPPEPVYGEALDMNGYAQIMPNLVSLPMEKFFNVGENPMTMDLDWSAVVSVDDKLDGSLISTVFVDSEESKFILKSKASLSSQQARDATALLNTPKYAGFKNTLSALVQSGFTVNMEYTAPDNQIVLNYSQPALRVLNVRRLSNGEYLNPNGLFLMEHRAVSRNFGTVTEQTIEDIRKMTGIEGYILTFSNGLRAKLKTDWYCNLHLQKEHVTNPRRLFESVINEQSDDLKALFLADPASVARIEEMEVKARALYNRLHNIVIQFHDEHHLLSRKDYAIAGQKELKADGVFSLAMNLYIGRDMGLKEHLIKNFKSYGIEDTSTTEE